MLMTESSLCVSLTRSRVWLVTGKVNWNNDP